MPTSSRKQSHRRTKKQPTSWLRKRIELLTLPEGSEHICTQYFDKFDPIQPWSLLKLGALRYLASIYLPIMEGQLREQNYKAIYYIDFFSGCGVNKIEASSVKCYGSPLIIDEVQEEKDKRFTKMFFNDIDPEKKLALESCLNRIKETDDFVVTSKDANERVQEIKHELRKNSHSLIFVDPNFMAFSWNSMETILKMRADIFFLYPTANVQRTLPKEEVDQQTQDFFKDYEIAKATYKETINPSEKPLAVLNGYRRDVEEVRGSGNTRTEIIRINGGSYYYDMLFISRRTAKNNPWWKGVTDLKNGLKGCDGKSVGRILRLDQSSLADWHDQNNSF